MTVQVWLSAAYTSSQSSYAKYLFPRELCIPINSFNDNDDDHRALFPTDNNVVYSLLVRLEMGLLSLTHFCVDWRVTHIPKHYSGLVISIINIHESPQ